MTADVGIAMGGVGTDLTVEAGDLIIMTDDLTKVPWAVQVGRTALRKIHQNIAAFAIGFNSMAVVAASLGYIPPAWAAVVHQISSLMVVCNSLTLLTYKRFKWMQRLEHLRTLLARLITALRYESITTFVATHARLIVRYGIAVAVGAYILSGIYIVRPYERAVVLRFGKLKRHVGPGLHYRLPYPMERVAKVDALRIRRMEVGFRTRPRQMGITGALTPVVYEWAFKHRAAGYERRPEEGLVITGDENLIEVNAVVHYSIADPAIYALRIMSPEQLLRDAIEATLRLVIGQYDMYAVLNQHRQHIEARLEDELKRLLARYDAGIRIHQVELQDVHPPLEADVVDAFHEVARAVEDKERFVNEAEAYRCEKLPLTRGEAIKRIRDADAFHIERVERAVGEAQRFEMVAREYAKARDIHKFRLYMEALEAVMPNLKKYVMAIDRGGKQHIIFLPRTLTQSQKQTVVGMASTGSAALPTLEEEEEMPSPATGGEGSGR
ncbi:MAG TPA: FtsH protease activity modulator HflK [Armatimonadetes bacterium]|nr:FtsH protease activity modulator HflK [Armatimonadota bacterium]